MTTSPRLLKNIAIVGAGLAGLSCAQALSAAGHHVDLFEKSRGASGRMSTRRGDDAGQPWQCDHGAQYFTADDAAFRAEVARWQQAGAAAVWDGQIASFDGQRWSTPTTDTERFVGTPRMTSPAACMVKSLSAQAQLHAQTTITKVARTQQGSWTLTSAEHGQHPTRYDALVLAVPAPQVLPLLADVSPAGHAIAASVRMRGSWALMLRCAARVDLPFDAAFINAGALRWMARDSSKPGRSGSEAGETWLLHAEPEWSEAHIEDDSASVTSALLEAFSALGGSTEGITTTAHRWRYADTDPASTPASGNPSSWWDAEARLGLCGDWLHGGKVQGAWLSGQHVAQRLLD